VGKRAKREQRHAERHEVAATREAERRDAFFTEVAAQLCPLCGASEVSRIGYGLPRFTADLTAGRVVLGGCDISGDDPVWLCRACKHSWGLLFTEIADADQALQVTRDLSSSNLVSAISSPAPEIGSFGVEGHRGACVAATVYVELRGGELWQDVAGAFMLWCHQHQGKTTGGCHEGDPGGPADGRRYAAVSLPDHTPTLVGFLREWAAVVGRRVG
jgi:ribosomal protein L37AE/L43A